MKRIVLIVVGLLILVLGAVGFFIWQAAEGLDPAQLEARYATEQDRFLDINGARVRVREQGPQSAPVVVLIHGFVYSLESFDAWADALDDDFRVIRYDLLGHGLTGPDPQARYAPEERAAFLEHVLDALGVERAHLAGNSLGGLVAWRFAASHPERVDRLILIDAGGFSINGVRDEPVQAPPQLALFLRTAFGVDAMLGQVYADPDRISEERAVQIRDMMRRRGNGQAFVDHVNEFTLPDPTETLGEVEAPTLIIWGGRDNVISPEHGPRFDAAIPDSELVTFPDLGHAPQEEDPEATVSAARAFLLEGGAL